MPSPVSSFVVERFASLRFPVLLVISAVLFGLDFVIPDVVPFIDEIFLGVSTVILATWRKKKEDRKTIVDSEATVVEETDAGHAATSD
ncbi:MAG: DUF6116 family protein [Acidobacteriota bacterium]